MKKRTIAMVLSTLLLIAGGVLVYFVDTSFGTVKSSRIYFSDQDGYILSGILYQPATATVENPAPAMITTHGGDSVADTQSPVNIELARRGYVVLSYDSSGHGFSEKNPADDFFTNKGTMGGLAAFDYVSSLPFVDATQVGAEGHSMGAIYTYQTALYRQDKIKIQIANSALISNDLPETSFNFATILSKHDQGNLARQKTFENCLKTDFLLSMFNTEGAVEPFKLYGNWEDGTARIIYSPDSIHEGGMIRADAISYILSAVMNTMEAPNPIDPANQIHLWKTFGMVVVLAALVVFMFTFASLLLESNWFSPLKRKAKTGGQLRLNTKSGIVFAVILSLIPVITFYPGTGIGNKMPSTTFMALSQTPNGYVTWGWINAVVLLLLFIGYHLFYGKKHGGNMIEYGLSTSDEKNTVGIKYIGKSLLFALLVVGAAYTILSLFMKFTGCDLTIWSFVMRPLTSEKTLSVLPFYILMLLPYYFMNSLVLSRIRFAEDETKGKGLAKAVAGNTAVALLGLTLLFTVFQIVLHTEVGPFYTTNFAHFYTTQLMVLLPSFAIATALSTYISKKIQNNYAGIMVATIYLSWILVCSNAVSRSALG